MISFELELLKKHKISIYESRWLCHVSLMKQKHITLSLLFFHNVSSQVLKL